jgi:hypothetical protein
LRLEYVGTALVEKLKISKWRWICLGCCLEAAHTRLVKDPVEENDNVAVDEAVAFNIILGDESADSSEASM